MKPIVHVPQPILTKEAASVVRFDKHLAKLLGQMKEVLLATHNPRGVGLAAPQISVPYRMFLARPSAKPSVKVYINPIVISQSTETTDALPKEENRLEGCLSIPKIWGKVTRALTVTLNFQDEHGTTHEETIDGFLATIVQHEVDHLNGILFTRRVLEQNGKLYQTTKNRDGKEVLEEIDLK